jgi:hypothetical protein
MLARQADATDLEIRISGLKSEGYPVEITVNNQFEFGPGYLDPDFLPWVPSARPREDGERLFGWLFGDDRLKTAWAEARGQHPERRIRLRIDEDAPELHAIPWELLRDTPEGVPPQDLAAVAATPFSRYLAGRWQPGTPIPQRPIKILVAIASPLDLADHHLPALDPEVEWALLQEAASGLDVVLVRLPEPCTLPALEEELWKGYHIVHLIAHGAHKEAEGAFLYLADEENRVSLVRTPEFAAMLARQLADRHVEQGDALRLVFLASCQTAACSPADAFRGLAPALVAAGVPAVVAMQDLVPVSTAQEFARIFYQQLLRHGAVDLACNQARSRLLTAELPGASIPVLYMRAQDGRLFKLPEAEAAAPEVSLSLPPLPIQPPLIPSFVGREAELVSYAEELERRHLAVICGMAGAGKTTMAAVLARQAGEADRTFWHTIHKGEGGEELIWRLAGFLYWQEQKDLWDRLQGVRQGSNQPIPEAILFDYLFEELLGQRFLLCLDDLDLAEEDPCLKRFLERLTPVLPASELRLIVTSQRTPSFVQVGDVQVLAGLTLEDAGRFLAHHGLPEVKADQGLVLRTDQLRAAEKMMTRDVVATLYERTGGNPTFLTLAANALKRTSGPLALLMRLSAVEEADIERFVMQEIDSGLTEEERAVMGALSVLLGYSGTRGAIEAVLDGQNVRRTLRDLSERHLLNVREDEKGYNYKLNALVRYFYYDSLSGHQRQEMHRRAGAYYEAEEPDLPKAALHFERAGEAEQAARLARFYCQVTAQEVSV